MKKYIKPEIKTLNINADNHILAGSDPTLNDQQGDGVWHAPKYGRLGYFEGEEEEERY